MEKGEFVPKHAECELVCSSEPEEWSFLGEGNRSIVCRYSSLRLARFVGKVLRLTKHADEEVDVRKLSPMHALFQRHYLMECIPEPLSEQFLVCLSEMIHSDRPCNRRDIQALNVRAEFGELMRDATLPFPETLPAPPFSASRDDEKQRQDVVTFEFKVKSGLYSTSPFLPRDHRPIKLHVGRYTLLQMFKYSRFVSKVHDEEGAAIKCPWGTFDRTSSYDPSDLCSRDARRVCKALAALTESPQNNLRVFLNGEIRADECELKLTTNEFSPLLISVFCQEELLEQLQAIQRIDILDVEGACAVFDRLCVITGGSTSASEDIIASYGQQHYDWIILAARGTLKFLHDSSTTTSSSNSNSTSVAPLAFPCDTIIKTIIGLSISLQTSSSGDDEYAASHALVALLTADECALLLNLWLLALSAKDASVMVAFRQVQLPYHEQERHVHQTELHSGIVVSSTSSRAYAYSLSLIDIGPKDIKKCWNKRSEEEAICAAYRAVLSEGF